MSAVYVWPPALPQKPQADGYKELMPSNLIRSETDTGPAKVRRRGNAKPVIVSATYVMTTAECATLDSFVYDSLGGGAVCFDWPRPTVGADGQDAMQYVRARLQPSSDGIYTKTYLSNFVGLWQVTLTLEIFPDVPLVEGES